MKKFITHVWKESKGIFKTYFWLGVIGGVVSIYCYQFSNDCAAAMKLGLWHGIGQMYGCGLAVFLIVNAMGLILAPLYGFCDYMDNRKNL